VIAPVPRKAIAQHSVLLGRAIALFKSLDTALTIWRTIQERFPPLMLQRHELLESLMKRKHHPTVDRTGDTASAAKMLLIPGMDFHE